MTPAQPCVARSVADLVAYDPGEAFALVRRQVGGGDVEALIGEAGGLRETVPGGGLGEIALDDAADCVKMSNAVLGDRVALRRSDLQKLDRAGFVLRYAFAVEQHDRIFDLAGDNASIGGALEPVRRLDDVLRDALPLPQHNPVGIGAVVVARIGGPQEQLRGLGEVGRPAVARVERHDPEVIERGGVVLGGGALELLFGAVAVLRYAVSALEQQHAKLVSRLGIAEIARQTKPARDLEVAPADRG